MCIVSHVIPFIHVFEKLEIVILSYVSHHGSGWDLCNVDCMSKLVCPNLFEMKHLFNKY